jgi:hypothetical protein
MNGFSQKKKGMPAFRYPWYFLKNGVGSAPCVPLRLSQLNDHADQATAIRQLSTLSILGFRVADKGSVNTFFAGSGF